MHSWVLVVVFFSFLNHVFYNVVAFVCACFWVIKHENQNQIILKLDKLFILRTLVIIFVDFLKSRIKFELHLK